jgi:uncharacterized protein (TIGR03083 family)
MIGTIAGTHGSREAEMSSGAVDALQADRDALIAICGRLGPGEWRARSGWSGWSVQGLVSHLAGGFWRIVDPAALPDPAGLTTEQAQDAVVSSRRSWTSGRVLDDYVAVSQEAIDRLARLCDQRGEISFGPLGTHPVSMVANSIAFDHYTHIRSDLCAPRGPLATAPPPSDEMRLVPALDWISAALPQQNAPLIDSLPGSLVIDVSPPGARTIAVGAGPEQARVETDPVSFIGWVTHRQVWADLGLTAVGDAATLDLARQLRVA